MCIFVFKQRNRKPWFLYPSLFSSSSFSFSVQPCTKPWLWQFNWCVSRGRLMWCRHPVTCQSCVIVHMLVTLCASVFAFICAVCSAGASAFALWADCVRVYVWACLEWVCQCAAQTIIRSQTAVCLPQMSDIPSLHLNILVFFQVCVSISLR